MPDLRVPHGKTAILDTVDGELKLGYNSRVEASNGKKVVVTKGVFLEGRAYVNCDLECDSLESEAYFSRTKEFYAGSNRARIELTGRHVGHLEVNGNLTVHKQLNVSHSVEVKDSIDAGEIDVGGKVQAGSIKCGRIRVGGRADIQNSFEASSVEVGGKVSARGPVRLGDLNVGGEVEVGGGSITGNIRVGGKFISQSALEFGELLVYGKGSLPAKCKGRKVSTFGKLEVDGDLDCDVIEAGGFIEIRGDCKTQRVEVGQKLEVSGSLSALEKVEDYGVIEVGGKFESAHLRVSGKLSADKIDVSEEADVGGKLETKNGLKAKLVIVRTGSHCDGSLAADRVEIGKSSDLTYGRWGMTLAAKWASAGAFAKAEDVYAKEVVIGPMSRVGRIFAESVKLEQGSAAEQITYSRELKMDFGAAVSQKPIKVDQLQPQGYSS